MGYKLAGCEVIGCCEIDKQMNDIYIKNHHPRYNYLMDIRDFNNKEDLPEELYNLDILDGSPPCSTFSGAGQREKAWGKEKKFREGQKMQTLDDLLFVFLDTVSKLKPKVFIMENVEGLLLGSAWAYVQDIYRKAKEIGYCMRHYLLKGEHMGVPQMRNRVFFIGVRNDIPFDFEGLDMTFNYEPILYRDIKDNVEKIAKGKMSDVVKLMLPGESVSDAMYRIHHKVSGITHRVAYTDKVYPTQIAGHADIWTERGNHPSDMDVVHAQTFPEDFDFNGANITYVCGMSVPPVMVKRIVTRLIESGLFTQEE